MQNITSIAASRLAAQQRALDVTADNIANAGTPGYKAVRIQFSDWLSRQHGTATPRGGASLAFTQDRATWRDFQPGPLNHTGNPLDLALTNSGYFTVSTPQGPRLTRAGRFGLLADGTIVDGTGNALLNTEGKSIQLSPTDTQITVAGDGTAGFRDGAGELARFYGQEGFDVSPDGKTIFVADGDGGDPAPYHRVRKIALP